MAPAGLRREEMAHIDDPLVDHPQASQIVFDGVAQQDRVSVDEGLELLFGKRECFGDAAHLGGGDARHAGEQRLLGDPVGHFVHRENQLVVEHLEAFVH